MVGDKSALLAQEAVISSSPVIDCSLLGFTATMIRPSRLGHFIYCWKVTIAVYVNVTILGYRLKKDGTSHFGSFWPWVGFGLILGVGRFSRKDESFRP